MNDSSYSLYNAEEPDTLKKLAVLAGKIAYFNFAWLYVAVIIFNSPEALGVQTFMKTYKKCIIMKLGKFRPRHRIHVPQFVFFLQDTQELTDFIEWIVTVGYDNTAKFIFVCVHTDADKCDENAVFATCIKMKITNVVFLRPSNATTDPVAFTYWPVRPGKCYDHQPERLDIHWDCPRAGCFENVFPEKLVNLYKCELSVSTFEQHPYMYLDEDKPYGLDGYILDILITALNATLKLVIPPEEHWGNYQNNEWSGSMGDIFHDRANLSLCSAPLTFNKFANFQISFPYNAVDLVWVSDSPALMPSWEKLYYPLKKPVRILIMLMFFSIAVLNTALKTTFGRKLCHDLGILPPKCSVLFYSWALFLGLPLNKRPSKKAVLGIIYSWILFAFIVRSIYQAALFDCLKVHLYEDNFVSLSDVIRNHRPFGGPLTLREYYTEDKQVYDKWVPVALDDRYTQLRQIAEGETNFVMGMNLEGILEYILYHNETKSVQIIQEKIVNAPVVAFFKKYSPLASPVSQVLCSLQEGGFTERVHNQFKERGRIYFQISKIHANEPLRLEHFTGAIGILLAGWVLAAVFFLVELYCDKLHAKEF